MSELRPANEVPFFPAEHGDYSVLVEGQKGIVQNLIIDTLDDPEEVAAEKLFELITLAWMEAALWRRREHEKKYPDDWKTPALMEWPSEMEVMAKRLYVESIFSA